MSGFNSRCQTFISICNQPPRPTQPSTPTRSVNEYQLWLKRKRQVRFILLADERRVWDPFSAHAISELLRGVFTTRCYKKPHLPYFHIYVKKAQCLVPSVVSSGGKNLVDTRPTSSRVSLAIQANRLWRKNKPELKCIKKYDLRQHLKAQHNQSISETRGKKIPNRGHCIPSLQTACRF